MKNTLRKNIPHLSTLYSGGKIDVRNPSLKIDGFGAKIWFKDGQFGMQTSRSDIILDGSQFIEYGLANFPNNKKRLERCFHYRDVFNILKNRFNEDFCARVELQYVPMGEKIGNKYVKFVNSKYYYSLLGMVLTIWIVPDDDNENIEYLFTKSGEIIKVLDTSIQEFVGHDIHSVLNYYLPIMYFYSPEPEGIVFTYNGKQVKITTDEFKHLRKK